MIRQRDMLKGLDRFMGNALVRFFSLRKMAPLKKPQSAVRNVLIIRPGGMGDAILLIPLLRAIKTRFPTAMIFVLAERRNAEIFEWVPDLVSDVFRYDRVRDLMRVLARRYDIVIDTEQWYRLSAVAARLIRADLRCGFSTNERRKLFNLPVAYDPDRYEAENFLAILSVLTDKPIPFDPERPFLPRPTDVLPEPRRVLIAPGASYPEKQWGIEKFRPLAAWLAEQGYSVGVIGGPADIRQAVHISQGLPVENFTGRATLRQTAGLIASAGLVIGGDSLALQIAMAFGTPSIALFGPTSPSQWAPRGKNRRALYHPPPCSPCSRFGHIPPCPYNVDCLKRITIDEVQTAVQSVLPADSRKPRGR